MTHPIIKTDNYILITSDEEIKSLDAEWSGWWHGGKKVIAHLPLNNSLIHKGVPLLPPFEDVKYDFAEMFYNLLKATYPDFDEWVEAKEYKKAKDNHNTLGKSVKADGVNFATLCPLFLH